MKIARVIVGEIIGLSSVDKIRMFIMVVSCSSFIVGFIMNWGLYWPKFVGGVDNPDINIAGLLLLLGWVIPTMLLWENK